MPSINEINTLQLQVEEVAIAAGNAILSIYERDFEIVTKTDESPLTEADLAAHNVIIAGLEAISDLPILSEESADIPWATRQTWNSYWLVDPLDGTKEFIKKNGEFTVNIALISYGVPVFGVVYAPVLDTLYSGVVGKGATKTVKGKTTAMSPASRSTAEKYQVVGSRSHQSPEIQQFIAALDKEAELISMGSSLKLCLVAEGAAHYYPRLGPTSEWDTGAAHAVALAAGATVTELSLDTIANSATHPEHQTPLRYNQSESLLNPFFLVSF
tara:strand:+ start:69 stop:881 length:813 start_codon:yes stop_codon:yes gene_type:complete